MYLAHISDDKSRVQTVLEHLEGTARLAEAFAAPFGAGELARQTAMAHDLGKYSREFQRRLEGGSRVDHSTAGAVELVGLHNPYGALAVAGHHGGIPDFGGLGDTADASTFMGRQKRTLPDYSPWKKEVTLPIVTAPPLRGGFEDSFYIRMLFSCLVDADYLDTETFMAGKKLPRGEGADIPELTRRLREEIDPWLSAPKGSLNEKRTQILRRCLDAGREGAPGLYSLTVPTGGGKTVSSLAFALEHALAHKKRRVVYVIPYTSIIEQTADTFRGILGEENVLEHHSAVDLEESRGDGVGERLRLAAENWDVPVVVTTGVQFFESLFSNKPSRCRKLHNLADSVVIFDEAQMLPLPYLLPCLEGIRSLVEQFGVTAVLCTATQPSLEKFFAPKLPVWEICPNTEELYQSFRRTSLRDLGVLTLKDLAREASSLSQSLCIVNSRAEAAELYSLLPEEGRYHLSTLMAPVHRRRVLSEIRSRLQRGFPCRVSATSLVEAGVDLDFPAVFRAKAGLDSVLQAAGRCNREGKHPPEDSIVYLFSTETPPPEEIHQNIVFLNETASRYRDIASPEAVRDYFNRLHQFRGDALDQKKVMKAFINGRDGCLLPFAQVAKEFHIIESGACSVLVPLPGSEEIAAALRAGAVSRELLRRAGQYLVSVYPGHFRELLDSGRAEAVAPDLALLTDLSQYHPDTGLVPRSQGGEGLFF